MTSRRVCETSAILNKDYTFWSSIIFLLLMKWLLGSNTDCNTPLVQTRKYSFGSNHSLCYVHLLFPQINKVYLGNDSQGRGRGIFVEEIEVHCADEDPVIFPCRCWLAEDEGDGKTARILVPGETIQPQLDSKPNLWDTSVICKGQVPFYSNIGSVEWQGKETPRFSAFVKWAVTRKNVFRVMWIQFQK